MILIRTSVLALVVTLAGCASVQSMLGAPSERQPAAGPVQVEAIPMVKPELDYSGEYPDCVTAGKRLAENVEVGMTLKEVKRLVGQPKWRMPGSWWWTKTLSDKGKPIVRFAFHKGRDDMKITAIVSDTSRCEPDES